LQARKFPVFERQYTIEIDASKQSPPVLENYSSFLSFIAHRQSIANPTCGTGATPSKLLFPDAELDLWCLTLGCWLSALRSGRISTSSAGSMRIFGRELEELERLCDGDDDGEADVDVERREGKSAWMICMDRTADMFGDRVGVIGWVWA
jgi:hypothetical protein